MPTFAPDVPLARQVVEALSRVRDSRHHSSCRCGVYRRPDYAGYWNAPFCSKDEFRWTVELDRLITRVLRASF